MHSPPTLSQAIAVAGGLVALLATAPARVPAAQAQIVDPLERGFVAPPADARPLVWWHWVNGNVSKAGIEADLADMKRVGIAGVQMFDVSIYLPPGPVRYGSDLWHEHVQHAIRTAAKHGLEFHAMNTPGWSASGGPWVTPERSMKQLVWSELDVAGGAELAGLALPPPLAKLGFYRDAAVLAVPADPNPEGRGRILTAAGEEAAALADGDPATSVRFEPTGSGATLRLEFDRPVDLAQLTLTFAGEPAGPATYRGSLDAAGADGAYSKVHDFNVVDHAGPAPQLTVAFKRARARSARLTVTVLREGKRVPFVLAEVSLGAPPRLEDWTQKIKMSESTLRRPGLAAPTPAGAISRAQVIDLTRGFDAATGRLRGQLPAGRWTILRFGFTSTGSRNHPAVPEGHGLEIDKLDADAVSYYFDQALGRMLREAGPLAGKTFKAILFDSFEGGPQNWTATFPAQFAALKGYDLVPLLPALTGRVIESTALTEAFLHDFRGAVEELIARNYFGTMRRRAHAHGLITYAEAQGGPLNPVSSNEHVDVPMNEFWMPETAPRYPRIKLVASVAHVLGRPVVAAESFTATPENGRWQNMPSRLKVAGDYAWTAGINRFILHHYTHQPTDDGPGFGLGRYGTNFGRLNTWWPLAAGWIDYVSRSQFLLQQGRTVADICFLQNEDHGYAFPAAMAVAPAGYDFDIVYPRHLAAMTWRDGALALPAGPAYRVLVLPEQWAADLPTLRRLRALARAGAPIVGSAPVAPAGVKDYEARGEYAALVGEVWGTGTAAGLIRRGGVPLDETLRELKLAPDVAWPAHPAVAGEGGFRHIHRRTPEADIYFVFNHSNRPATGEVNFRVAGRRPEFWNTVTGTRVDAPVFRMSGGSTTVPLSLEPYGSTFVVFRRPLPARWVESTAPALAPHGGNLIAPAGVPALLRYNDGRTITAPASKLPADLAIAGPWRVAFVDGRGAPPEVTFDQLQSWTDHPHPGVKYYSGVAVYRAGFSAGAVPVDTAAILHLGAVADLAEVRVNGTSLGVLWQPPFRVEVTRLLRPGENTLEVRVANRWINRIIGDESVPTELTYQKPGTNKFTDGKLENLPDWLYDRSRLGEKRRVSFTTWKHYSADSPLVSAGLIGPVRIEWRAVIVPSVDGP